MEHGGTEEAQAGKHEEGVQMNKKIKDILKNIKIGSRANRTVNVQTWEVQTCKMQTWEVQTCKMQTLIFHAFHYGAEVLTYILMTDN